LNILYILYQLIVHIFTNKYLLSGYNFSYTFTAYRFHLRENTGKEEYIVICNVVVDVHECNRIKLELQYQLFKTWLQ